MLVFYKVDILYKVVQTDSFIRKFHFWDHIICFLGLHLYLWTRSSPLFTSPLQFPWVNLRKDPSFWKGHRLESSVAGACTQDPDWLKQKGGLGLIELSGPGVSDWNGTCVLGRLVSRHLSPLPSPMCASCSALGGGEMVPDSIRLPSFQVHAPLPPIDCD